MQHVHTAFVHPWFLDAMGHLTTRHYMGFFDDASLFLLSRATGWRSGGTDWQDFGWADVRHELEYRKEVSGGAIVEIFGCIEEIGGKSLTTRFEMRMGEDVVATMKAKTVFFDLASRRATPLTATMREQVSTFIAGYR